MTGTKVFAVARVNNILFAPNAVVFSSKVEFVDKFLIKECGVSGVVDLNFAHHLTNNDLEVLIVDLHTLQTIDVLNLIDDVFLNCRRTLDGKDVCWCGDTIGKWGTSTNGVMLLNQDLLGSANKVLTLLARLGGNDNFAVTTFHLTHSDLTVNFADDGGVGRVTRLEQFGNTR